MAFETLLRTHTCNALRAEHVGQKVKLAGWIKTNRNLGGLNFFVLRDHYGITQVIVPEDAPQELKDKAASLRPESVVLIEGEVLHRNQDVNADMDTGEIEVKCTALEIDSLVEELPFPLNDILPNEELRLKYRFFDLRRDKLQKNIRLRAQVIHEIRYYMINAGFNDIQTPILTASSPEGARDYVVASRVHPGKFYALPQAPQQYKQLLMCAGMDKYFQIAPCFRDEDARADRSPGEFYQLDIEMSFIGQDDLFVILEGLFQHLTDKVSKKKIVANPFPRIKYMDAMNWYGSDKPDIRYEMKMQDVSSVFEGSEFRAFAANTSGKNCIKALVVPGKAGESRKFFDNLEKGVKKMGAKGLAYINYTEEEVKGPIVKFLSEAELNNLKAQTGAKTGDSVLLVAGNWETTVKSLGHARSELGDILGLKDKDQLAFCWIVDFPMFEWDEDNEKVDFSHNPFSMPQGGMEALKTMDPLDILAYQYDIVCNGIELSSGAIRNHRPDIMYKAFDIVGYSQEDVDREFGHMIDAFTYGAPPHGGLAPGLDRIVMIFADEPNIREVTAFPMNQKAQELMMGAPAEITQLQLDELSLKIEVKEEAKA